MSKASGEYIFYDKYDHPPCFFFSARPFHAMGNQRNARKPKAPAAGSQESRPKRAIKPSFKAAQQNSTPRSVRFANTVSYDDDGVDQSLIIEDIISNQRPHNSKQKAKTPTPNAESSDGEFEEEWRIFSDVSSEVEDDSNLPAIGKRKRHSAKEPGMYQSASLT
jgi:hypothetical protein